MAERRPPGFNVDLGFYDSDEVLSIPRRHRAAAVGVWTLCGAYSAGKLTDGHVSAEKLRELGCTSAIRDALMATKPEPLWVPGDQPGAIQFTRWTKWQRTCAEVKGYRESEAERKRNARDAKRKAATRNNAETSARTSNGQPPDVRPEDGDPKTETETETESKRSTSVVTLVVGGPGGDPKLPVAAKAAPANTRGMRLPNDWKPSPDVIAAMREQFPHADLKAVHEEFCDYWRSIPGAKGRRTDWDATWRNRVREIAARQRAPTHNGHTKPGIGKPTLKALGWEAAGEELLAEMEQP